MPNGMGDSILRLLSAREARGFFGEDVKEGLATLRKRRRPEYPSAADGERTGPVGVYYRPLRWRMLRQ